MDHFLWVVVGHIRLYHLPWMTTVLATLRLLLVLLLASPASCTGSEERLEEAKPERTTDCANESGIVRDETARTGPLTGDVTGDGEDDDVYLAVDEGAEIGCRSWLLVGSGDESEEMIVTPIDTEGLEVGPLPSLVGLRQIDGDGGSDVVVNLVAGASTLFASVYTFEDGGLEQLEIEDSRPPAENLFAHGGGVGQLSAADCTPDGTIVISTAIPVEELYEVTRLTYELDGGILARDPTKDEVERARLRRLPELFPEFAGPLFGSCPSR